MGLLPVGTMPAMIALTGLPHVAAPLGTMPAMTALAGLSHVAAQLGTMPALATPAGLPHITALGGSSPMAESIPAAGGLLSIPPPPGGWDGRVSAAGNYVGGGMPLVPARLARKIRRWEFVEMGELLPESWVGPKEQEAESVKERRARQGRKVTDIFTWVQCFGTYVAVLAPADLLAVPELMAYMGTIVRMSQDYEGLGWVRYDLVFRRQAALSGKPGTASVLHHG